jgi:signal transduction histidine kinase
MWLTPGRRLAWAFCAVTYLLVAIALAITSASLSAFRDPQLVGSDAQDLVPAMAMAVVGALVASRLPRNALGWALLTGASVSALDGLLLAYQVHTLLSDRGSLPAVEWAAWLQSATGALIYPGILLLILLLFPDGRLPSPRWRAAVALDVALTLLNVTAGGLDPSPIQFAGLPAVHNPAGIAAFRGLQAGPIGLITFLGSIPLILAGIGALIVRLRGSSAEVRQQVRWVVYALAISTALNVLLTLSTLVIPPSPSGRVIGNVISNLVVVLGFGVAVPAAIGVAILKYRLYDIDLVISRTLVYGALAVFISAVYVGIVVGIGGLIGSASRPNLLLSIVATAVVAVAFQPIRERVEALANRLVFGYRANPYELLSEFSHRVAGAYADEEVLTRLARVLVDGTAASVASIWLRGSEHAAATWPEDAPPLTPSNADRVATVRHEGEILGELTVKKRSSEPFTPVEDRLVSDLAAQAGQVLRNVRLTSELRARVQEIKGQSEELRASRQRIVATQDAERRRLERNIHDGAQQHLVALAVKLRLAAMTVKRDREKTRRSIEELTGQIDDALTTLRDLARGIYPQALAEGGLVSALRQHAQVNADGVDRFDPEIEAAVYFCCLEALQNAAKYAGATEIHIDLEQKDGSLHFAVTDNGRGFDPDQVRAGSGTQNMQDRISSLGGSIQVESAPGRGATVTGVLPVRTLVRAPA